MRRTEKFWRRVTDGMELSQLWNQFRLEARSSYRLYSREMDSTHTPGTGKGKHFLNLAVQFFWAIIEKLSPAHRVILLIALLFLIFNGGVSWQSAHGELRFFEFDGALWGALLLLLLVILEVADRVVIRVSPMKFYSVRHLTKFVYSHCVSESVMETRMHPRSDSNQRCLSFSLSVSPRCRVFSYRDHLGNQIQHFDIPVEHNQLVIIAESLVEQQSLAELPQSLVPSAWADLDALVSYGDYWEMLLPSEFAKPIAKLQALAAKLNVTRRDDPLMLVRELNQSLFEYIQYVPRSTRVDSPIDEAIESQEGVCQDFAHTVIALLRYVGIPCRYVSGYLYQSDRELDRS